MEVQIKKLSATAILPNYAHSNDAGMDIYANEAVSIKAGQRTLVGTGITLAIPDGYVGLIWDKSGMAVKNGITTLAGVIDAGYRGEVKIALYNTSSETYEIEAGHKIAQMLVQTIHQPILKEVDQLMVTKRGTDGFGSTGI